MRAAVARILCCAALGLALIVHCCAGAHAQAVVRQEFETPETSWREGRGDPSYRIELHQRTSEAPHAGSGCEFVQFVAGNNGTFVHLTHDLAPARIIAELQPTVWVRSDRSGIQLLARVVFPRSLDPTSGQPATALVAGTSYARVQNWEQLRFDDLPKLAAAQARVLRAELKREIDPREAFIDRLVLNIYTGPGRTRLWIDDLEVAGFVGEAAMPGTQLGRAEEISPGAPGATPISTGTASSAGAAARQRREGPKLKESILITGGRPFFPRAIEHQGESFKFLKERGFNTIRLRTIATPDQLAEAASTGMWLICPPPMPAGLDGVRGEPAPLAAIPVEFDSVLAWDVGEGLTGRELEAIKRWVELVRRADALSRPILCGASAEMKAYSSRADVLLVDRYTPSTTFELTEYRRWLRERPRLARPNTPTWTAIPTQPAENLTQQIAIFSGGRGIDIATGSEHARLLAFTALGAGARGLLFASQSSLSADDRATRWRAAELELINIELDLIEPWAATGLPIHTVTSTEPEIVAAVISAGGSQLLLPVWSGSGAQYVPGQSTGGKELSFVVPGVPETTSAYEILPGGLRPLRTKRVTGGISVTLDDCSLTSMVLLTQNLLSEVTRRALTVGERGARLQLELAQTKYQLDSEVHARLPNGRRAVARGDELLKTARTELEAAQTALNAGKFAESYRRGQFTMRNLRALERGQWQAAVQKMSSPVSNPLAVSFATLPEHYALLENINASRRFENRLKEGNFEDLGRLIHAGWRFYQHPPRGIRSDSGAQPREIVATICELSATRHVEGNFSVRLAAVANDPKTAPEQIETPPAWITSPPVAFEPGTLVRLHARVLIPEPIAGSSDGLMVIDSLGGEVLADRVLVAKDWKEVTAYRIVDGSGTLSITFALTGLGEAWIDDVTIEPLAKRDLTRPQPDVTRAAPLAPLAPQTTRSGGRLFR